MKGDPLPEEDRVVRYLSATLLIDGEFADGAGFCLRRGETGLSVNWLEVLASGGADPLSEVRRLSRLRLRKSGRFAELRVGDVLRTVNEELDSLRILHDPLEAAEGFAADPSHSQIAGLPPADTDEAMLVGDMIAECVTAMHPAVVEPG